MRLNFPVLVIILIASSFLYSCNSRNIELNADWNANFVVWEGHYYNVSNEKVDKNLVGIKVGTINTYSSNEKDVKEGETFSNFYPIGTELYEINDVNRMKSLAVKNQGKFFKLNYVGGYGE